MPVVWKRRWGEGRVFYCSLGHIAAISTCPRRGSCPARDALGRVAVETAKTARRGHCRVTASAVGLIGCGYISGAICRNAMFFPEFEIVACADPRRSGRQAAGRGVRRAAAFARVAELLADPKSRSSST